MSATILPFPRQPATQPDTTVCHFCGHNSPVELRRMDNGLWAVKCVNCRAVTMVSDDDPEDAA